MKDKPIPLLDPDWYALIVLAKKTGLTKEQVLRFLSVQQAEPIDE
ncbi:anti-repressor SinI family protein [Bacillus sp. 1P06AnD]